MNFQIFKLDLERAEEPDIKLPTSTGSLKKQESSRKTSADAAAATKSLQSCPTLCDPRDGSPPGPSPWDSPGNSTGVGCHFLLQCMEVKMKSLSRVRLLATPRTAADQAPPSVGFSRQEYWSGVPLPSPPKCSTWVQK